MQNPVQKTKLHPMLMAAAVAVILFCGIGIAAVMGWLPSSNSGTPPPGQLSLADQQALPPLPPAPAPAPTYAAVQPAPRPAPEPVQVAEAKPAVCKSCGVVESIREVTTRAEGSGVGAAGGAVLGGLLGNQVGGGHGRQLATVAGAIGGAVVGNQVEGSVRASRSYAITVRMNNGATRTVSEASQPAWRPGDRVRIVNNALRANG